MSAIICRPCIATIATCPDLFSGGTTITPIPTRQKVCNTVQTASCPDGTNVQTVAAGTFCTIVLNPTATTIASAQAQVNAMALAQAQSQVGDCAWESMVWTTALNQAPSAPIPSHSGSGMGGQFSSQVSTVCVPVPDGNGQMDWFLDGHINYAYGAGILKHHRVSVTWIDNTDQYIQNKVTLFSPTDFSIINQMQSHGDFSGAQNSTVSNHFDFTAMYDGVHPIPFHLQMRIQVYSGNVGDGCHARSGSVMGTIIALD